MMYAGTTKDYKTLYEQSEACNQRLQLELIELKQQLSQLKKMIFAARQERFIAADAVNPAQLSLGMETAAAVLTPTATPTQQITYQRGRSTADTTAVTHPGRMKLPEHLRRECIEIEPTVNTEGCKKIGEEITEVLEYKPGELYVKQYRRAKYALANGEGIVIGQLPSRPIEKAMAGSGLLAQIVIDKYVDHLPLHRQMQRFERAGVKLSYATISDWVSQTCSLLSPLYMALKNAVLQSGYLHADETPIKVLDKDKKGQTHRGFFWVYHNSIERMVLFDYRKGHGREGPAEVLQNFKGYLQTDGYAVYDAFDKRPDIVLLHCMAHARRMFHEALDNDPQRAGHALAQMQQLYRIEHYAKDQKLDVEQIHALRQSQAVPILAAMEIWLKEHYAKTLPKSAIGKAIAYALTRWETLCRYTQNGMLAIDNNPVENSIRPVAIGRKNYLFCGSHEAAIRSAMLYSLMGTCKMNGINPAEWLNDILQRLPDHPINQINQLLPQNWK